MSVRVLFLPSDITLPSFDALPFGSTLVGLGASLTVAIELLGFFLQNKMKSFNN